MHKNKKRLLFISKGDAMFIKNDKKNLKEYFDISSFVYPNAGGIVNIFYLIKLFTYCLFKIPFTSYVYIWFADYYSVIPLVLAKMLGKRSILVIGGYDAAKMPGFHYGAHRNELRSRFIDVSCKSASKVITVSKFVDRQLKTNTKSSFSTEVVYNAIPYRKDIDISKVEKKYVCTVVAGSEKYRYLIKGIDIFLGVARKLPNISFLIIGPEGDLLKKIKSESSENVLVLPKIPHERFIKELRKVRIICQFSRYESFGVSVIEAMGLGAMPITASHTGTSEIVPDGTKHRVNINDDILKIANKVRRNYFSEINTDKYRQHVENNFRMSDRIVKILNIIEGE